MATLRVVLVGVLLLVAQCMAQLKFLGEFKVARAGFSNVFVHEDAVDPKEKYSIILSSFNPVPFTRDDTYMYRHIGKELDEIASIQGQSLSNSLNWPREPSQTPSKFKTQFSVVAAYLKMSYHCCSFHLFNTAIYIATF